MHIALFLQYYHTPDCATAARPYALVERLGRDHRVTVVTTSAWDEKRLSNRFPWAPSGVRIVSFDVPYDNTFSPAQRLGSFLRYAAHAVKYGLRMSRPDVIIGSSTPLTAAAAAGAVARIRDIPWIFEVRDLWPDFPIQMDAVPDFGLHRVLYAGEAALYRSADHVVTLSPDMEAHVQVRTSDAPATTIPYGTDFTLLDEHDAPKRRRLARYFSLEDRFVVLYAGTLGRANDIPTLMAAARRWRGPDDVLFVIAGQGAHEPTVRRAAENNEHVRLLPPLPYPEALALFRLADVSLVPFLDRPVLASNAPGKFFDSLAAGTPVVVTNPGWTKRFVEQHDCGWYVPAESPAQLSACLESVADDRARCREKGKNARTVARQHFRRDEAMNRYASSVRKIGESHTS